MSVDAERRRVNRPVYTVPEYVDVNVLGQRDSQAQLRSNFPSQRGNVVGVDCGTSVVGGPAWCCWICRLCWGGRHWGGIPGCSCWCCRLRGGFTGWLHWMASPATSPARLAGDVVVEASPAVAGAASLADIAEGVTVEVAPSAVAGVASLTDAGVASPADLAGVVTVGVASLADGKPEVPLYGFRELIPGAVQFSCTDTPMPDAVPPWCFPGMYIITM